MNITKHQPIFTPSIVLISVMWPVLRFGVGRAVKLCALIAKNGNLQVLDVGRGEEAFLAW
jgi:hypothetical protein